MAVVDNSATAWARMLIANGADPQLIEAWIRHELAVDPLAFRALMTPDEIAAVQLRVIAGQVRIAFHSRHGRLPVGRRRSQHRIPKPQ